MKRFHVTSKILYTCTCTSIRWLHDRQTLPHCGAPLLVRWTLPLRAITCSWLPTAPWPQHWEKSHTTAHMMITTFSLQLAVSEYHHRRMTITKLMVAYVPELQVKAFSFLTDSSHGMIAVLEYTTPHRVCVDPRMSITPILVMLLLTMSTQPTSDDSCASLNISLATWYWPYRITYIWYHHYCCVVYLFDK